MDDDLHASSKASGAGGPRLRLLPSITILAEADETEVTALEDWARGLDWVHWLFSSIRHRLGHLYFAPAGATKDGPLLNRAACTGTGASVFKAHPSPLLAGWQNLALGQMRSLLGPTLIRAWQAARKGNAEELVALDHELSTRLPGDQLERSLKAGALLLRSTQRARYQGVLHHYRKSQHEGGAPGHFLIVWAAVGHFFQLSLANVLAEYLRLEWTMAARDFGNASEPDGSHSITRLTGLLMKEGGKGLKLMGHDRHRPGLEEDSRSAAATQS